MSVRNRGPPASAVRAEIHPNPRSPTVDDYSITETTETWRIRVRCSPEEVAAVAASIPKAIAGMTGCYQPDVIHVHQALQAAAEAQAALPAMQPRSRVPAIYGRN